MSTVLLSTINEKIVYKAQGNVTTYTEGKGNGISFSLSVNKRENVEGSLPLTPTRIETITILSPQAADGPDGSESLDRISSAKVYESGVSGNELLVSSNSLVKGTRSIKLIDKELSFKAYTFGFPAAKQLIQGKTYTVELLLPDETTFVVDINTGVPNEGNLSRAAFIVTKVDTGYIASNAATPLIEITGSDDVLQPTPDGDDSGPKTDPLDTNSLVYADNIRVEEAKRFIKNIRWRWDVVSERGNKPKNGFRPKMTMRRFAPGAPLNSIRIILDMITDAAPYINPVVSGDVIQGKWKPRVTWFRKDMQQQTYDLRADATVTIIQDLVPDYEDGEGELVNGGGNCARIQEIEYVWDAAEVSTPPLPYPQGVTYDVQGINRDDESGLFNYMLVKSIAQEQHFGPYIASSSKKSYATREVYKNAYNLPADIPQEGDIVDGGKVTQVNIDVNADCTYDITIVKSYTTKASAVRACAKTAFEHDDTVSTVGNEKELDEAPPASGGVVTVHTSRLDDDGTYTNEIKTNKEEKDVDYITDITSGPFLVTRSKVVRGSSDIKSTPSIGSSKATKSDGGLYTTEVTEYVIRGGEEATEKQETTTTSKTTRHTVAPVKDITKASAEDGKIVSVSARQDNQGAWHNVVETTIEKKTLVAEVKDQSPFIVTNTKTTKNATEKGQLGTDEVGRVSNVLTAGGRTDVEITTYTIKGGEEATEKVETSTESKFTRSSVSSAKDTSEASAKNGKIVAVTARQDNQGAWHNQVSLIVEKTAVVSESTTKSPFVDTNTVITKNSPAKETIGDSKVGRVINSLTDGGLNNTEVTTYDIKDGLKAESNQDTAFNSVCQTTNISSSKGNTDASSGGGKTTSSSAVIDESTGAWTNTVTTTTEKQGYRGEQAEASAIQTSSSKTVVGGAPDNSVSASAGEIVSASSQLTETGLYKVTKKTTKAIAKTWVTNRKQPFVTTTETNVINSPSLPSQPGIVTNQSARMNEFGLYDGSASGTSITGGMAIKSFSNTAFESSVTTGTVSGASSAAPGQAGGGKMSSSRSQIDESTGAWTNTVTTTTEKQGNRGKGSSEDAYQKTTTEVNIQSSVDTATHSAGKVEVVTASMTESGLYKQSKDTTTTKELQWTTTSQRPLGVVVKVEEFRNKKTKIDAPQANVYRIEEVKNKYGVFDGSRTTFSKKGGKYYASSLTTGDIDSTTREYTEQKGEDTIPEPEFEEFSKGSEIITKIRSIDETTGLSILTRREEKARSQESEELTYNAGSFKENTDKFIWNADDINSFKPTTDENTVSASVSVSRDKFGKYNGVVRVVKDLGKDNGEGGKWQSTFDKRGLVKVIHEPHLDSWQPYMRTITITYDYGIKEYEEQALEEYMQSIHLPQYGIVGKLEPIRLTGRDTHYGARYTRIKKVVIQDIDTDKDVTSKLSSGDGKLPSGATITFNEGGLPVFNFKSNGKK